MLEQVTVNGKKASGGTILFDPLNVNRKSASAASAEIGKDGTYTIKTLVGEEPDSGRIRRDAEGHVSRGSFAG